MAKRITYGQTWWGKQWLNALSNIDYSNRLPRGKSYANKGAVKDFIITKNTIKSSVQGSEYSPYKQKMSLVPFTNKEKELIVESIRFDVGILAELLNRQMPGSLDELLQSKGIRIFPKDWTSLKMNCSCPDYAVPCKHLAAVVYLVTNEVDKNPFLLFGLRGLDLLEELKKQGLLTVQTNTQEEPSQLGDFTVDSSQKVSQGDVTPATFSQLSFALPSDGSQRLLQLLDTTTLFYQNGSFKDVLKTVYKKTARYCNQKTKKEWLDTRKQKKIEKQQQLLLQANDICICLDKDGYLDNIALDRKKQLHSVWADEYKEKTLQLLFPKKGDKVEALLELLEQTNLEQIWKYPNEWIALYSMYRFAQNLALSANFMPRLLSTGKRYRIQWIPASLNAEVKENMHALLDFCPSDLLLWFKTKAVNSYLSSVEQLRAICDLFIGHWVFESSFDLCYNARKVDTKVLSCFIEQKAVGFNGLGEVEIPSSIQVWLRKFYMQHKAYVPLLKIEEDRGGFAIQLQIEDRETEGGLPIPLDVFLSHSGYASQRLAIIQDIQMLSTYIPQLSELLKNTSKPQKLYCNGEEFEAIFFDVLPVMELLGITILLPKSLRRIIFPRLSMSISKNSDETGKSFMSLYKMLEFNWRVAIGDRLITAKEFRDLVAQKSGLVKIQNEYIHIDQKELQKLLKQLEAQEKLKAQDLMQAAISGDYQGAEVLVSKQIQEELDRMRAVKKVPLPKGLKATLRPYQLDGFSWLYKNAQLGMGSILADDMGLGKTLQVITLILKFKEEGLLNKKKALVTVPTSLLTNWQKEVAKFAPSLKVAIYHGPKRVMPTDFDILVTSYGILRSDKDILKKYKWHLLTIDEAQNIKNVTTIQTKAVKAIKADLYIAMSGTPVENRLSEYWSIMDFANKGYLGTLAKFTKEFAKPIQKEHDTHRMEIFKKITSPFVLRRMKTDKHIIKDLPEKIENDYYTSLEKEQAAVYESLVKNTLEDIEDAEGITRKGLVLSLMMGLKQVCNHPYQYLKKGDKSSDLSGKAKVLFNLLDNIQEKQEKVLIFTQYTKMGNLMVDWIKERYGRAPLFLHGAKSRKQRDAMVDAFQENRQDNIFILSLKAGGTGLNLTAANNVIHYDLWWNPAVEAQATDRAYRIGQQKNVMVYRLITEGTLEERIDKMLKDKKELASLTVATGNTWLGDLSDNDLGELVRLNPL